MKCFYCGAEIEDDSVVGMCRKCMHEVWGEKMTNAIISNMEKAREKGDLELWKINEVQINNKKTEESEEIPKEISGELKECIGSDNISFDGVNKQNSLN